MTHSFSTKLKFTKTILLQIQVGIQKFQVFFIFRRLQAISRNAINHWAAAMHFMKDQCDESGSGSCSICSKGWIRERLNGIPEPMPDYQRLPKYHYKSVFDTSVYDDNNKTRGTDEILPRPNIASALHEGQLSVDNKEQIDIFCNKFIVEENLVKDSLEHLINLRRAFHGLSKNGKKGDKISRIMAHWILTKDQFAQTRVAPNSEAKFETEYRDTEDEEKRISDDDDSYDESDANDEVIAVISDDDSETVSDFEDEKQNIDNLHVSAEQINIVWDQACNLIENRTRSGRIVRSRTCNDTWTYL